MALMAGLLTQAAVTPQGSAATEVAQTIVIHSEDIVPLHTGRNETTLIVLPEKEKAMGVFVGDKTYWNVDVIPGAERYIAVKPSKAGAATDIHIVTDHNNSYTFQATEGGSGPVALKIFVKPVDASSLEKPPVFVSASVAEELKQELAASEAAVKKLQASVPTEIKANSDLARAEYPEKMRFDYTFSEKERNKPPFNIEAAWHDDRFTYIRAHPTEAPALYELKDGKPNLVQFELHPDGTYFIPKILGNSYLQVGKKKLEIWQPRG